MAEIGCDLIADMEQYLQYYVQNEGSVATI